MKRALGLSWLIRGISGSSLVDAESGNGLAVWVVGTSKPAMNAGWRGDF